MGRSRLKPKLLIGVFAAVLIAGGAALAYTRFMAPADDEAVSYVPADAIGYANVFIEPSNGQKQALDRILRKFPGIDDTDAAIDSLVELIDVALQQVGMSYEDDVEPWLGDQVAGFVVGGGTPELPNFAVLVESKDDDALNDFLDRLVEASEADLVEETYEGQSYWTQEDADEEPAAVGVVDGFLVAGTEDAFEAAVDAHADEETLEDDEDFVAATDPLNDDWIGLFYLDTAGFVSEFAQTEGLGANERAAFEAFGLDGTTPQAAVLYAADDSVTFESSGGFNPTAQFGGLARIAAEPGLVPELPADAWFAYGIPDVGGAVGELFETFQNIPGFDRAQIDRMFEAQTGLRLEDDVLSWMEDAGLFVRGTNIQSLGGGLVIESTDPAKTARVLARLEELVTQRGIRTQPETVGDLEGFSVSVPGVPAPVYALGGDRLVIGYGDAATEAATGDAGTLAESEAFGAAQDDVGDDFNISFYVDVDVAQRFGETAAAFAGAPMDTYEQRVKPYLDVLTYVVGAAKMDGDTVVQKLVVGFE